MAFGGARVVFEVFPVVVNGTHPILGGLPTGATLRTYSPGTVTGGQALLDYPNDGTHVASIEALGGGHILALADFDLVANYGQYYANNRSFSDSIASYGMATSAPEPATFLLVGISLATLGFSSRLRRK